MLNKCYLHSLTFIPYFPSTGCEVCRCKEVATCSPVSCLLHCPAGREIDDHGCETCQCKRPALPTPNNPMESECGRQGLCKKYCEFGFEQDENGCQLCRFVVCLIGIFSLSVGIYLRLLRLANAKEQMQKGIDKLVDPRLLHMPQARLGLLNSSMSPDYMPHALSLWFPTIISSLSHYNQFT